MKRRKFLLGAAAALGTIGLTLPAFAVSFSRHEFVHFPKYKTWLRLDWEQDRITAYMTPPDGQEYAMAALLNVKPFDNETRRKMLIRSAERTLEKKYAS